MKWTAVTRSVIGNRHLREGMPCQDFGGDRILGNVMIGAIADGAGSATQAEKGAQLATMTMLDYLEASEKWLQRKNSSWVTLPEENIKTVAHEFFTKALKYTINVIQEKASTTSSDIQEFACTLIAFVATPHAIATLQIGDGLLVVRLHNEDYHLVFQPDKGEYANQTTFLTSNDALDTLKTHVIIGQPAFICASTDGLESVAIRRSDWTPFPPFFNPLEEFMLETRNPDQNDGYLTEFLTSERLNQRTDDDKTVLLSLYR